jgi:hypothetical protein
VLPTAEMTLDQALALALTSPSTVQAELVYDQAAAQQISARAVYDPVLTASGSASSTESAGFLAGLPSTSQDRRSSPSPRTCWLRSGPAPIGSRCARRASDSSRPK